MLKVWNQSLSQLSMSVWLVVFCRDRVCSSLWKDLETGRCDALTAMLLCLLPNLRDLVIDDIRDEPALTYKILSLIGTNESVGSKKLEEFIVVSYPDEMADPQPFYHGVI